jgi:hypothetical protein
MIPQLARSHGPPRALYLGHDDLGVLRHRLRLIVSGRTSCHAGLI